jgi:hypothetical protein
MSQITLSPNAAGTGIFTVAAPGTSSNRTLTLPDQTGTLATSADVSAAQGMVVLGTLTMTSGASQSLPGLDLTPYKQLLFDFNGVSHNAGTVQNILIGAASVMANAGNGDLLSGNVWLSLWSGVAVPFLSRSASLPANLAGNAQIAQSGYSTATTTVAVSVSSGAFDAGSIRIYGVK